MENTNKEQITKELRKHELCKLFWSEKIVKGLDEDITLKYEPIGEFGIHSKYYEFSIPYVGGKSKFLETRAVIKLGITANTSDYDIKKAIAGIDCFHNVQIQIFKGDNVILTNKFRLWSGEEDEFYGNKDILEGFMDKKGSQ